MMQETDTTDESDCNDTDLLASATGEAEVQIDIDEETHEELREKYRRACQEQYGGDFASFVVNNCRTTATVTVDGESINSEDGPGNEESIETEAGVPISPSMAAAVAYQLGAAGERVTHADVERAAADVIDVTPQFYVHGSPLEEWLESEAGVATGTDTDG